MAGNRSMAELYGEAMADTMLAELEQLVTSWGSRLLDAQGVMPGFDTPACWHAIGAGFRQLADIVDPQ